MINKFKYLLVNLARASKLDCLGDMSPSCFKGGGVRALGICSLKSKVYFIDALPSLAYISLIPLIKKKVSNYFLWNVFLLLNCFITYLFFLQFLEYLML